MPHIAVPEDMVGIGSLMATSPASGRALCALAEQVLRGPSPLTQGERELIAAMVSDRNGTAFCAGSHSAVAAYALAENGVPDAAAVVAAVRRDPETAPVSEKMRALLALAAKVARSGHDVTEAGVRRARDAGAGDADIHDAVLVAAAFCMYNRYVDGLAAREPADPHGYDVMAKVLAVEGYDRDQFDRP